MHRHRLASPFLCFLLLALPSGATIRRVNPANAGPIWNGSTWTTGYKTIADAMVVTVSGDQIWLAVGSYPEEVWLKSGVTLLGGYAGTDAQPNTRDRDAYPSVVLMAVNVDAGASSSTVIDGLVVQSNTAGILGQGQCHITNNLVRNCLYAGINCNGAGLVQGNTVIGCGLGAIGLSGTGGSALNNRVMYNRGGGIYAGSVSGTFTINNNVIISNSGGAVNCGGINCVTTVSNNVIAGNSSRSASGVIEVYQATATIANNTIVANYSDGLGAIATFLGAKLTLANNIVAFNDAGVNCRDSYSPKTFCNDVFGNTPGGNYLNFETPTGNGNISIEPRLVNVAYGNFHLQPDSPCKDAGNALYAALNSADMDGQPRTQPAGGAPDIGADESDGAVWSTEHAILHVATDGNDINDGSTWLLAMKTVQKALNQAADIGGAEIRVARGTYAEHLLTGSFVYLYGGYQGGADGDIRDLSRFRTVLDGSGTATVAVLTGGGSNLVFDGFTVRNGAGSMTAANGTYTSVAGGLMVSGTSGTVSHCTITANTASYGGGVYSNNGAAVFLNNVITGNGAYIGGGGAICDFGTPVFRNNVFNANNAAVGGGFYNYGSDGYFYNNTVVNNNAGVGGGLYTSGAHSERICNNIIAFNSSGVTRTSKANPLRAFARNCVYGNNGIEYQGMTDPTGTNGNIRLDPKMANAALGRYHLQPDSPCIDAGDNSVTVTGDTDVDGQARVLPAGGIVDIGADESDGSDWPSETSIIRVKPGGDDSLNGLDWDNAKRTVKAAVDAASVTGGEVWVAGGLYTENVVLAPCVSLFGGFAGTETAREQRDWAVNASILDGGKLGSVVVIPPDAGRVALDGFTIRNGKATFGAGVLDLYAMASITHNTITGNAGTGTSYGGGLAVGSTGTTVIDNTIAGNSATYGAGMEYSGSWGTVSGNRITANTGASGGGLLIVSQTTGTPAPLVTGNEISSNTVTSTGGGLYVYGVALTLTANRIDSNSAYEGGGLWANGSALTLRDNAITRNVATRSSGGGIFTNNSLTLVGNTIAKNSAVNGGALSWNPSPTSTLSMTNNIVAFNTKGLYKTSTTARSISIRFGDVYGNTSYNFSGFTDPGSTNGNTAVDPMFVEPASDFHLQDISPCVNTGDDKLTLHAETDADGLRRILGPHVDMGAFEHSGTTGPHWPDVVRALQLASGLAVWQPSDADLDLGTGGIGMVNLLDALRAQKLSAG